MGGLWIDLQDAWARASGQVPSVTCKRDWACAGGMLLLGVVGLTLIVGFSLTFL